MWRVAGILHALALLIALCVQSFTTPLAGMWVPFYLGGCAFLLADKSYRPAKTLLWWAAAAWLVALTVAVFIVRPVNSGASYYWFLFPLPSMVLCLHEKHLRWYALMFGIVITAYVVGVDFQALADVRYHGYEAGNTRTLHSWPILDPNNAALLISIGIITIWYAVVYLDKDLFPWLAPGILAMYATGSRSGIVTALAGCGMVIYPRLRPYILWWHILAVFIFAFLGGIAISYVGLSIHPEFFQSLGFRVNLWSTTLKMIWIEPWRGIGFAQFPYYYSALRTEPYTAGFFAHNDPLEFIAEMGIPLGIIFWTMPIAAWRQARQDNSLTGILLIIILFHSLMEFQLYVPVISILAGFILAAHNLRSQNATAR